MSFKREPSIASAPLQPCPRLNACSAAICLGRIMPTPRFLSGNESDVELRQAITPRREICSLRVQQEKKASHRNSGAIAAKALHSFGEKIVPRQHRWLSRCAFARHPPQVRAATARSAAEVSQKSPKKFRFRSANQVGSPTRNCCFAARTKFALVSRHASDEALLVAERAHAEPHGVVVTS